MIVEIIFFVETVFVVFTIGYGPKLKFFKELFARCFNANPNSCILSDLCTFCTTRSKFGFCRQILWDFWHIGISFENETFGSLQHYGWFCAWFTPMKKVKVFKERPARTFLHRLAQSLFTFWYLCASFALRASARFSFLWSNCPITVPFFPMKIVVPVRSYLP